MNGIGEIPHCNLRHPHSTSPVPRPVREEQQITEALLKTVGPEDALGTMKALLGGWFASWLMAEFRSGVQIRLPSKCCKRIRPISQAIN